VRDLSEAETPGLVEPARLAFRLLMTDLDQELSPVIADLGSAQMQAYWRDLLTLEPALRTVPDYVAALARRTTLIRQWSLLLEEWPLVVLPQMTGPLITVGEDVASTDQTHAVWRRLWPSIAINLLGLPSLLAPTGLDDAGLPTGVQLVAARFREDACLSAGRDVEAALPPLGARLWQR
jgi:amidase